MTLLAFQNHTWPSGGGGGSAPAYRGGNESIRSSTTTRTIPFHANTVEGDTVVIAIAAYGTVTTFSAPSGWVSQGALEPLASIGFYEVFVKAGITSGEASTGSIDITLGAARETSGFSMSFDSGTVGAVDTLSNSDNVSSHTAPTIAVDAGSTTVVVSMFSARGLSITSPTPDFYHNPDDHSFARTGAGFVFEDEAGPNNTALTIVTGGLTRRALWSIELEAV